MQGKEGEEWLSELIVFSVDRLQVRVRGCAWVLTAVDSFPSPPKLVRNFWGPKRNNEHEHREGVVAAYIRDRRLLLALRGVCVGSDVGVGVVWKVGVFILGFPSML